MQVSMHIMHELCMNYVLKPVFFYYALGCLSRSLKLCLAISWMWQLKDMTLLISMISCLNLHWILLLSNVSAAMLIYVGFITKYDIPLDRLGFGVELNALKSKEKVPFAASFDECQLNCFQRFLNPAWRITEPLTELLHPWKKTIAQHLRTVDDFANGVIESRRTQLANGETHYQDLLSRFMNAHNEHDELLSNKELRDIVLNFVIAGRDTTAQALSWTFYMLLLHPRIEKKLLEEVLENVSDDLAKEPAALFEVIKKMTYAHAV